MVRELWIVANFNANSDRANLNGNRNPSNRNDDLGIVLFQDNMKTNKDLYSNLISPENLILAWRNARKGKTKKEYVIQFEENLMDNLIKIHYELKNQTYKPKALKTFILRDPKTRKISKSDFRDRIVHHAIVIILEPIFEKSFIYDSCANRKGKGTLQAIKRFEKFRRKVTNNFSSRGYCLKADIKHYFEEVNHAILLKIIASKIKDEKIIWLIKIILERERRTKIIYFRVSGKECLSAI